MKSLSLLICSIAIVSAAKGPTSPNIEDQGNCELGTFYSDTMNTCWYYWCVQGKGLIQMKCAQGTRLDDHYISGKTNPCTHRFEISGLYDCTRKVEQDPNFVPACFDDLNCLNGGVAKYEGSYCWCDCPVGFLGDHFCAATNPDHPIAQITADFVPDECADTTDDCSPNPCNNGAVCVDMCAGYWCDCVFPFTADKQCSAHSCDPNPCMNGGQCNRQMDPSMAGQDEFFMCTCFGGFTGAMCENQPRNG